MVEKSAIEMTKTLSRPVREFKTIRLVNYEVTKI